MNMARRRAVIVCECVSVCVCVCVCVSVCERERARERGGVVIEEAVAHKAPQYQYKLPPLLQG